MKRWNLSHSSRAGGLALPLAARQTSLAKKLIDPPVIIVLVRHYLTTGTAMSVTLIISTLREAVDLIVTGLEMADIDMMCKSDSNHDPFECFS